MALTDPVPSQATDVFRRNMGDSDSWMNQTSGTVTNRTGKVMRPLPVISDDIESQVTALEAEIVNVTDNAANAFGFRPAGLFTDGFAVNYRNEVGIDSSGNSWIYNGALPFTVTPGTIPSEPTYTQVSYSQALNIMTDSGRNLQDHLNDYTSLKDYAVGNGIADDTAAWNSFVSQGGGLIPAGNYKVDGIIKSYLAPIFVNTKLNNQTLGLNTFESNTTGYNNTAFGNAVLQDNTSGYDNLAIGVQAMRKNTTGNRNTAVGVDALAKNTTGDHNLALGQNALGFNTTGTYNTALGIDALEYGENNNFNIAIGQYAALNLEGSNNNTVCGYNTFQAATSGNSNVAYGSNTLENQEGVSGNTAIGTDAVRFNTAGTNITAVGFRAARSNTAGTHLTAIGDQAAFSNLTGTHNVAVGFTASYSNTAGTYNVSVGDSALYLNTGSNNIGVGGFAGYNVTTGTHNTFIGHGAGFNASQKVDAVNTTAIGRGAFTTEDNTVQLGNPSVATVGVGANKIGWSATVPSSGTWARGSVVFNLGATAGGAAGWMCVESGTPGVWKAMANLAV